MYGYLFDYITNLLLAKIYCKQKLPFLHSDNHASSLNNTKIR